MQITKSGDETFIIIGETLKIPVLPRVYDTVKQVEKLTVEQQMLILQDVGLEVVSWHDEKNLLYTAMSFVQNAWYQATAADGITPAGIIDGHNARLKKFEELSAQARKKSPKEASAPKPPKPPKEPKAPKAPKTSKTAPSVSAMGDRTRVAARRYAVNPAGDPAVITALSTVGFVKPIYETLVAAGSDARLSVAEVITLTTPRKAFSGADGGKGQAQYQLKYLAGLGLALYFDEQGNTPMPDPKPSELPQLPIEEPAQ